MITIKSSATIALAAFLSAAPSTSLPSDEEQGVEEIAQVFIQLLNSVESEFDCLIKIVSIDQIAASTRSVGRFYAEFRAAGIECGEASDMLLSQGRAKGIIFYRRDEPFSPGNRRKSPILDLIHEIDPPIDN